MRILFFTTHDGMGGSELLWLKTAHFALKEGHQVGICVDDRFAVHKQVVELLSAGATLFLRKLFLRNQMGPTRLIFYFKRVFFRHRLFRQIHSFGPDFILINQGNSGEFLDYLRKHFTWFLNQEYFYGIVDHAPIKAHVSIPSNLNLIKEYYNNAAFCAFVSDDIKHKLESYLAGPLRHSKNVRNPVNLRSKEIVRIEKEGDKTCMAIVGALSVGKGHKIVLNILAQPKWNARGYVLNVYGTGDQELALKELAKKLGIIDSVQFHGYVDDIKAVWERNELNILPSYSEGSPISIVEAMICGRPTVATNVGGVSEWIDESVGFLAASPSEEALDEALEKAWNNRDKWTVMGMKAHKRAISLMGNPESDLLGLIKGNK